jgi:hypothetical protein
VSSPTSGIPTIALPRLCACGCGALLEGKRPQAVYLNGACRARASRARGKGHPRPRKPHSKRTRGGKERRKPDLRISYRKAVDAFTELPELAHLPAGARARRAQDTLRPCLPPRLKDAA